MKRWRTWMLAATAVALIAVVVGAVVAVGQGGDDSASAPTGERTLLRVEAGAEATCGATVLASIYLDDLETRPSPYDESKAFGLVAFELPITYDPRVLQIGEGSNVVLNDQLDEVDSDRDGVLRNWIPASHINDGEGWAMVAGSSYNPNSGGDDKLNREEGIVPSQSGAPLLLATVRFSVIGEGDSSISIESGPGGAFQRDAITLYDPAIKRYESAEVKAASVTGRGGDCAGVVISTPIPTRAPAATLAVPPTPTVPVWSTVEAPDAAAIGRTDCPATWVAYIDPEGNYSLCYPKELEVQVSSQGLYLQNPRGRDGLTGTLISVVVSQDSNPFFTSGVTHEERCAQLADLSRPENTSTIAIERIGSADVPVCIIDDQNITIEGELLAAEGYIRFRFFYTSPDSGRAFKDGFQIVDTLRVGSDAR